MVHTTIMRWVHQYGPQLDERVRRHKVKQAQKTLKEYLLSLFLFLFQKILKSVLCILH